VAAFESSSGNENAEWSANEKLATSVHGV